MNKKQISVAEYLKIRYNIVLDPWELKIPLLHLTQRGQDIFIVPSRCHEASLPKDFAKDANKMRNLRKYMINEPNDRF